MICFCIFKCFYGFIMFIWISYLFVNFLCFWNFVMFRWISFGFLNSYVPENLICFNLLLSNAFVSWYPTHGQVMNIFVSRCQKGKSGIFNARDGQKLAFPKPKKTLIYWAHVPKYIWWNIYDDFCNWFDRGWVTMGM